MAHSNGIIVFKGTPPVSEFAKYAGTHTKAVTEFQKCFLKGCLPESGEIGVKAEIARLAWLAEAVGKFDFKVSRKFADGGTAELELLYDKKRGEIERKFECRSENIEGQDIFRKLFGLKMQMLDLLKAMAGTVCTDVRWKWREPDNDRKKEVWAWREYAKIEGNFRKFESCPIIMMGCPQSWGISRKINHLIVPQWQGGKDTGYNAEEWGLFMRMNICSDRGLRAPVMFIPIDYIGAYSSVNITSPIPRHRSALRGSKVKYCSFSLSRNAIALSGIAQNTYELICSLANWGGEKRLNGHSLEGQLMLPKQNRLMLAEMSRGNVERPVITHFEMKENMSENEIHEALANAAFENSMLLELNAGKIDVLFGETEQIWNGR